MGPDLHDPTEEEFSGWLRATQTLSLFLEGDTYRGAHELYRRLLTGLVIAAGLRGDRKVTNPVPRSVIPQQWWGFEPEVAKASHRLWSQGSIAFTIPGLSTPLYEYFGIRFESAGVYQTLDDLGLSVPARTPTRAAPTPDSEARMATANASLEGRYARKLTRQELMPWCQRFGAEHPGAPFAQFLRTARAEFHPRPVTERILKNVIAELGMTLSVGNPAISQKNR